MTQKAPDSVRLAELIALLSLGTDLGFGQPMEHVIRQCLIALRLAEHLEMDESDRVVLYYSALLTSVGCHSDAYELAKWFGDDIRLRAVTAFKTDEANIRDLISFAFKFLGGIDRPIWTRARVGLSFLGEGRKDFFAIATNHYTATDEFAENLGLGDGVRASLGESYERWDGRGPFHRKGDESRLTSRLVNLALVVEVSHREGGVESAIEVARRRSGSQFDPGLVDLFCDVAPEVLGSVAQEATWDQVIAAEPALERRLTDAELGSALNAIADFVDLKSPWTLGHSRSVAALAERAGREFGLPVEDVTSLRRASLLHDIGRLGVSNAIWDKATPLSRTERERVRLHPYFSERMLAYVPALQPLAAIAVQHHERLDGTGYPRGIGGDVITPQGRILAAADCYQTMIEMRPHRPAKSAEEAAKALRGEVTSGLLDGNAVGAVLRASGHTTGQRRELPAGLTQREVEVLRLLVRGFSNREIAEQLVISRKTAGNHVEHIYAKIGVTNRARAALFAVRHGLMSGEDLRDVS